MRRSSEEGFTLLELVFAMVLLSIGIAALIGVLATSFRSTAVDIHRTDATAIAGQGLTELEAAPVTGPLPSITRNAQTYTLAGTVTPATASNGSVSAYPTVAVTVSWRDAAGAHSLTRSTAFFTTPPTTAAASACTALGPVAPVVSAPTGDPSVDVSWQEPTGGPVSYWEVQISPDGSTWTTPIADEPPLVPGATHQLEIGGLSPNAAWHVQVVATNSCGGVQTFPATSPTTPSVSSTDCLVGSMTLGPADAERISTGAAAGYLTSDVVVILATSGSCPIALFVRADTGQGPASGLLVPHGSNAYVGTLSGLTQAWTLGVHEVDAYNPPDVTNAIGTAELCVEEQGAATC
jgi:prepilin-type N-terminal cleavage/methylation domain-containing protein